MECKICIFCEDGEVYGYWKSNKMVGLHEFNYPDMHVVKLIGKYPKDQIKKMHPHASFVTFNDLGKYRIERIKILELKENATT